MQQMRFIIIRILYSKYSNFFLIHIHNLTNRLPLQARLKTELALLNSAYVLAFAFFKYIHYAYDLRS